MILGMLASSRWYAVNTMKLPWAVIVCLLCAISSIDAARLRSRLLRTQSSPSGPLVGGSSGRSVKQKPAQRSFVPELEPVTINNPANNLNALETILNQQGVIGKAKENLLKRLSDHGFTSSQQLVSFAKDFDGKPEVLSSILMQDFAFPALDAHRLRAAMIQLTTSASSTVAATATATTGKPVSNMNTMSQVVVDNDVSKTIDQDHTMLDTNDSETVPATVIRPNFKDFNVKQKNKETYGIKECDISPQLADELEQFLQFMITPSPKNQEPPIRRVTAKVYCTHARLFLGWILTSGRLDEDTKIVSLDTLFPAKDRDGAAHAYAFVMWLRETRKISVTYEANVLRGLIKLCKFCFREESQSDPLYDSKKTYEDIPAVAELRRLHRNANGKQSISPRVSDERKKWLSWSAFISVISSLKSDLENEIACSSERNAKTTTNDVKIATLFQRYLILSIFSVIPDRQRTIRELNIGIHFFFENKTQLLHPVSFAMLFPSTLTIYSA